MSDGNMEKRFFASVGRKISLLGFGLMRLPILNGVTADIDYPTAERMVGRALDAGINYFDTAWIYHENKSEVFAGEALSKYPRDKYCLATKMPPWVVDSAARAEDIFNQQMKKCHVDYFDFYLMHNLCTDNYEPAVKYRIYEFLHKKKEEGAIRRLGFSIHDTTEQMTRVLNDYDEWDFVQIQINYIDWDTLGSKRQYEILTERGIPVVVMEPVRGGALASLTPEAASVLKRANPEASLASWAIRYAADLPGVLTVLSGMTSPDQLEDNIDTMTGFKPLSDEERNVLKEAIAIYRASGAIPCTGCRYCMDCPSGVDIPRVFEIFNHYRVSLASIPGLARIVFGNTYRSLTSSEQAHNCTACEVCVEHCPQGIDIPKYMNEIADFAASS
ncbi:MAG: aldo/keto reductase [Synergistaceae bacterium]|jgi:predicted aldo/keto reductase-like oxidoreductase|nr:aldo/keto reductase [Synergistaceae bacterium]